MTFRPYKFSIDESVHLMYTFVVKILSPEKLIEARLGAKYKKRAPAARAARINRKTLIDLEKGNIKEPSHRVLSGLARAFKCTIDDFFVEAEEPHPAA